MKSLAKRMIDAAETLEEASALYGYPHPEHAEWTAQGLRHESEVALADYTNCSGALADLGDDE